MTLVELNDIITAIKGSADAIRPSQSYSSYDFSDAYIIAETIANAFDEIVNRLEKLNSKEET